MPAPASSPERPDADLVSARSALALVTAAAIALAAGVIALGATTRLLDAGLGCPDWPGCYGHLLWPSEPGEVARANRAWPDSPVALDKAWLEMAHRYAAGALLLAGVALVALARRAGQTPALALALLALMIAQALFGMWTVTLKLWPQVVVAHLLGGFATLALLCVFALRQRGASWRLSELAAARARRLRPLAWLALALVVAQLALGGWTSANYAALACPDLPRCQGEWWPDADWAGGFGWLQPIGPNYLFGLLDSPARTAIHLAHRMGALLVAACALALAAGLLRLRAPSAGRWATALACALGAQLALGAANVLWQLPPAIAVLHNAGGAALLAIALGILYHLHAARPLGAGFAEPGQAIA